MTFKFPIQTTEDWRFTDSKVLNSLTFDFANMAIPVAQYINQIKEHFIVNTIRIVMINGFYMPELSDLSKASGNMDVSASNLEMNDKQSATNQLDIIVKNDLDAPIHFLNIGISNDKNIVADLQVNFIVQNNIRTKLIEEHISYGQASYLYKSKTMLNITADASLDHTFIQAMAKTAFNVSIMTADLAKNSSYNINMVINGARLSRHDLNVNLNGIHAVAGINGLCLINERQVAGLKTIVKHNVSDTKSNHLHKSIVDGGAHSMFNGTICVGLNSARTESHQQNRSLMLSKKSRITTEPKLEINNDDVICTHGATISQMDEDIVFFLKSRGICELDAKRLCISAFANEIMDKIEYKAILKSITIA